MVYICTQTQQRLTDLFWVLSIICIDARVSTILKQHLAMKGKMFSMYELAILFIHHCINIENCT